MSAKDYLIKANILKPKSYRRQRNYDYTADCWRRHLVNIEAERQYLDLQAACGQMITDLRNMRYSQLDKLTKDRYEELLDKQVSLTVQEVEELVLITNQLNGR